MTNSVMRRSTG